MTLAELQQFVAAEVAKGTAMDSEIELLVVGDFGCVCGGLTLLGRQSQVRQLLWPN